MGRKPIERTVEQLEALKQRWWGPKRNARRRSRYATDPDVRRKHNERNRQNYRAKNELVVQHDCSKHLDRLAEIGEIRTVWVGMRAQERLTFLVDELAEALDLPYRQIVYRWKAQKQIPAPYYGLVASSKRKVYLEEEVRAMMAVFAQHQAETAYYRTDHTDTRDRMFAAVHRVRETLGA